MEKILNLCMNILILSRQCSYQKDRKILKRNLFDFFEVDKKMSLDFSSLNYSC